MDDAQALRRLQELSDRADILDCVHRYTRGMDRQDRELLRSAYHDDAIDDHGYFVGPVEDFIDWAFAYHQGRQVRHQHYVTNHTVELDGDTAHAETYVLFVGVERDPSAPLTVAGSRYIDRFERRRGRWAIAARKCVVEWQTEPQPRQMKPEWLAALDAVGTIARDRTDASYERPLVVTRTAAASQPGASR